MICENPGCHCQSEFGVLREGRMVCSVHCRPEIASLSDLCHCGHPGCGSAEEFVQGFEAAAFTAAFA